MTSSEEQLRILLTRIGALQQEEESNQAALVISKAKAKDLKKKLAVISPTLVIQKTTGTGNNAADLMRSRLYELQLKEQDLLSKFTDDSEPIRQIRRQIREAQALLAQEDPTRTQVTTGINTTHQQLSLDLVKEGMNLASLEAKTRVLRSQQDLARKEVINWNDAELQMVQLQRELSLLQVKYHKYSENLEQARIDQALEINKISNISVVQPAMVSMNPVRPKKMLNLALGLLLGVLGGIALAFGSEYLDQSVKNPQDVQEKLSLPLLASIPYWEKELSHSSSLADRMKPS
jgi:uncharacterized protein involved in exopolysaccharide biosynthesis